MTDAKRGILAMTGACTIWGLSPLYYKLLAHVPPLEILSHRTLWSLVVFGVVLRLQGRIGELGKTLFAPRAFPVIFVAAAMISLNWFTYILSIQIGRTTEASLGYYMFPLVAVMLGVLVLGERLTRAQGWAVALAATAVVVLTLGLGVTPWISLILASSFGLYGLIKKRLEAGPVLSVTAEVAVLAPLALGFLLWLGPDALPALRDPLTLALLIFSGPMTAVPLILFSYAARRTSLATLGLVQYLNPTLQFFCAVMVFREPFTQWHAIAFGMIWLALAIYSVSAMRQERALSRAARASSTSATG